MQYDLKIVNGTVYDGLGGEGVKADIAVKDGIIVEIGACNGVASDTLDAAGHIVTPGFIDLHTHYDGQVSWDDKLEPSSRHGVTTAVMGNCGVGFAPCRPDDHNKLIRLMEGVEDIPGSALAEGLTWDWESFPDYMNAIDFPHAIDFAVQVVHDPLRVYVMGDRAVSEEAATKDDIEAMKALAQEAMEAGAVGISTGRTDVHRTADGEWTPSSEARVDELMGIASAIEHLDYGVLQLVNDFNLERGADQFDAEFDIVEAFADAGGKDKGFSLSLMQRDFAPNQWRQIIERVDQANQSGHNMHMQVAPRGIGVITGLKCTFHPFIGHPSYKAIAHRPLCERVEIMADPAFKEKLLRESPDKVAGDGTPIPPIVDMVLAIIDQVAFKLFLLGDTPEYEQPVERSIGAAAQAKGMSALSEIYDILLQDGGGQLIYFPIYNYTDFTYDNVLEMMQHPKALMGLSDGGAHVGTICDGSFPTYLLSYWTRDRINRGMAGFTITEAVQKLTSDVASYAGMHDRGSLSVGKRADINVIDHQKLAISAPHLVNDLPAGGQRLMQDSMGYKATFVAGVQIIKDSQLLDARPGRLVRMGQGQLKVAAE